MRFSILLLLAGIALGATNAGAQGLRLLISTDNATVISPYPLALTLHFLNAGKKTLWLYQPVRSSAWMAAAEEREPDVEQSGPRRTEGGSDLEVTLTPLSSAAQAESGKGDVILPMELPHPRLVRIPPGGDAEEHVRIHLEPAMKASGDQKTPVWGAYQISVNYRAWYSNADEIERVLGVDLWHAEATSNTLHVSLQRGDGQGAISGQVTDSDGESAPGMLVSLSDRDEQMIGQARSDADGGFSFDGLAWGFYWVTVRRPEERAASEVFQHAVLSEKSPSADVDLMLLPSAAYQPKQFLHKPILLQLVDKNGHPVEGVEAQVVFSNGAVVESLKANTGSDGVAEFEVIPGSNFLSIKQRGCEDENRRMDVEQGGGVDGFQFELSCQQK